MRSCARSTAATPPDQDRCAKTTGCALAAAAGLLPVRAWRGLDGTDKRRPGRRPATSGCGVRAQPRSPSQARDWRTPAWSRPYPIFSSVPGPPRKVASLGADSSTTTLAPRSSNAGVEPRLTLVPTGHGRDGGGGLKSGLRPRQGRRPHSSASAMVPVIERLEHSHTLLESFHNNAPRQTLPSRRPGRAPGADPWPLRRRRRLRRRVRCGNTGPEQVRSRYGLAVSGARTR